MVFLYTTILQKPMPGIEKYGNIVDTNKALPLTAVEQAADCKVSVLKYVPIGAYPEGSQQL